MSFSQSIRKSRLGSCWKCMSLSVALLAASVAAFIVSLHLNSLEETGFFGSDTFVVGMAAGVCVFALLTTAHAVCLVLRFTVWSDERV